MKITIACVVTALLGWLAGSALSRWEYTRYPVDLGPLAWKPGDPTQTEPVPQDAPRAVVVGGAEYDFGTMPRDTSRSHVFVIENQGERPLVLSIAETTCQCTVGELDRAEVPPGEQTRVTLSWKAEGHDREFRQSATLRTNDPQQPSLVLSVSGNIRQMIRTEPTSLALSQISRNETTEAHLRIYAYDDQPLEFERTELMDKGTEKYFQVTVESLSEEQLKRDPEARSGVLVTVRLQPGLPLGPMRQELVLQPSDSTKAPLIIPIQANVVSDVSVLAGADFDRDLNLLRMGRIDQQEGKSATLHLLVKGPNPDQIELRVGPVDPADVLQVQLGEPRVAGQGSSLIYPLEISVPPGARAVSRLGSQQAPVGRVVLYMSGTDATELLLRVSFVVLGS